MASRAYNMFACNPCMEDLDVSSPVSLKFKTDRHASLLGLLTEFIWTKKINCAETFSYNSFCVGFITFTHTFTHKTNSVYMTTCQGPKIREPSERGSVCVCVLVCLTGLVVGEHDSLGSWASWASYWCPFPGVLSNPSLQYTVRGQHMKKVDGTLLDIAAALQFSEAYVPLHWVRKHQTDLF